MNGRKNTYLGKIYISDELIKTYKSETDNIVLRSYLEIMNRLASGEILSHYQVFSYDNDKIVITDELDYTMAMMFNEFFPYSLI